MNKIPLIHAWPLFIIWVLLTISLAFMPGHQNISLEESIKNAPSIPIISASLLLLIYLFYTKSYGTAGLMKKPSWTWLYIYPILLIGTLQFGLISSGEYANLSDYQWIFFNTLFVGISEELMFRGIILSALVRKHSFIESAVIMSLAFGTVHILNIAITGEVLGSIIQAFFATFSGIIFLAIRVKTNSIYPAIILHWLFDFTIFGVSASGITHLQNQEIQNAVYGIMVFISPFVFGISGIIQLRDKKSVAEYMQTQKQH